jgi:hypothetical protein
MPPRLLFGTGCWPWPLAPGPCCRVCAPAGVKNAAETMCVVHVQYGMLVLYGVVVVV